MGGWRGGGGGGGGGVRGGWGGGGGGGREEIRPILNGEYLRISDLYKSLCKVAGQSRPCKSPILYKSLPKVAHINRWAKSPIQVAHTDDLHTRVSHINKPPKDTHSNTPLQDLKSFKSSTSKLFSQSRTTRKSCQRSRGCDLSGKSSILTSSIL